MLINEIISEGYQQVWGRSKKGVVRRYRCTDGAKKGRVVAKPSTCGTAVGQSKSQTMKKTRRTKGASQSIKRGVTMKRPTSRRIAAINKGSKSPTGKRSIKAPNKNRKQKR
jgi:hypothetical protein